MRILVADDEMTNRCLMETYVRRWGHEPVVACDDNQAWSILQSADAPQMALLDWVMPGMNGPEICRSLRGLLDPPATYIIMVTSKAERDDIIAGLEAGADDYLTKPVDASELRARLNVGIRLLETQQRLVERESSLAAARARLEEEERFRVAVTAMRDGLLTTDAAGVITFANRSARLLLGLPEYAEGVGLEAALAGFEMSPPWETIPSTEQAIAFELTRQEGAVPLFISARLTRLFDARGRAFVQVLALRDVTEERRAQEVEANFLNVMSHKLRTPLTVLRGCLALCHRVPPHEAPEKWDELIPMCDHEARRLHEMIERLFQWKDLDGESEAAEAERVDLAAVLESAAAAVRERCEDKEILIESALPDAARHVRAAPEHATLILRELVGNAVKFNNNPRCHMSVASERVDGDLVRVSVCDDGPGIPHEYADRVLRGYLQVERNVTGRVPGLGLGLSMVQAVVEAYGGSVDVDARRDAGAKVSFTLPAA